MRIATPVEGKSTVITTVLMIEQPLAPADVDLVTSLHGTEPVTFVVLMQPRGAQDRLLRTLDDVALGELETAAKEAGVLAGDQEMPPDRQALEQSLRALRSAGAEAVGELVDRQPLSRLSAIVERTGADEVIVLTSPHLVEEFFHRDWASRARHQVGVPVLKLLAHPE